MSLEDSYNKLREGIDFVNELIEDAHSASVQSSAIKNFIIESAFLKMFIYWEGFLEESFVKYLSDSTGLNNTLPQRYILPNDSSHAQKMIIGTQKYVDWANVEIVKRLSNLYLKDGIPFNSTLSSINQALLDLKTIRNNTAHISTTTIAAYKRVIRERLPNWNGDDLSVSEFLMSNSHVDPTLTILQVYQRQLLAAAEIIKNCDGY